MQKLITILICLLSLLATASLTLADEGMWLLNGFPTKRVQEKYGFKADQKWLDHVRLSSARLAGGCSGSFVSPEGLVMTNHHCAHSCIQQLSESGKDYIESGFYAKTLNDEVKCPEIEINQLTNIKDVTADVKKKVDGLSGQKFSDAQKEIFAKLEKDCSQGKEGLRCDVVTLYHGGQYHLYQYRRFQDVRLVFAPEFATAFFGGDPDNFRFPRYDLDLSMLRVYENGKPLKAEHYFPWSKVAAKEGDLTFVTGHPGKTSRLLTISELETQRDLVLMRTIAHFSELRGFLNEYKNRGKEQTRTAGHLVFGVENSLKALKGRLAALVDAKFFQEKKDRENKLIQTIKSKSAWNKEYGTAWEEIAKAQSRFREIYTSLSWLEANRSFNSDLFGIARALVRAAKELPKPNGQRLQEYTDSKLPALKQKLFSTAPIYDELEAAVLGFNFTKLRENLTADHPLVKRLFAKESPTQLAEHVVKETSLKDVGARKKLFEGGWAAIEKSNDPMIKLAIAMDDDARAVRKIYENEIESVTKKSGEKIAKAEFLVHGTDTYPDATFTLRVSYGKIEGYKEDNGKYINPITTMAGAFERHTGYDPFKLPESWLDAKSRLNLQTPLNFASTNDIIGGNSGSPVINKNAEVVGLVFDGNIQSLGGEYGFDPTQNRAVSVHSAGILEALDKIYRAERIVKELKEVPPAVSQR